LKEECEKSFLELKRRLSAAPVLALPEMNKPHKVYTDASKWGTRWSINAGKKCDSVYI
jgi:hypothetical protein